MARLKIIIPENYKQAFAIPIRINDINNGNYIRNHAFVSILHDASVQWSHRYNFTEFNIDRVGITMSDLEIKFTKEYFLWQYY